MTMTSGIQVPIEQDVILAPHTTIKLGGKAKYFVRCSDIAQIHSALGFAEERGLRIHILGGGSNVIFADEGFDGLVIHIALMGAVFVDQGSTVRITVCAGEEWDAFVKQCIAKGLGGVECLSGIPGMVGATPIQNVGAYGQEVRETIVSVKAVEKKTGEIREFTNAECAFGYRQSRFKGDADRYIITEVTFQLKKNGRPEIRYPELQRFIGSTTDLKLLGEGTPVLQAVRDAVLDLRRGKSMVLDAKDPNSRSVGSFFMNPVLTAQEMETLRMRWQAAGGTDRIPTFVVNEKVKVPAAWLVERSGFSKGFRTGGVGISQHHSLALVNYDGTTRELMDLATRVQHAVLQIFGIHLQCEPIVVPP